MDDDICVSRVRPFSHDRRQKLDRFIDSFSERIVKSGGEARAFKSAGFDLPEVS